jgi:hypothetical protein
MAVRVNANSMTLEIDDHVATTRLSQHAPADDKDAWIVAMPAVPPEPAIDSPRSQHRLPPG